MGGDVRMSAVAVLLLCLDLTRGANILALLSTVSESHHIWNSPLFAALAERGHNVTVLSPQARVHPVPNITDLVLTGIYNKKKERNEGYTPEVMVGFTYTRAFNKFMDFFGSMCRESLETQGMKTLMSYPDNIKFDLAIIETTGGECFLGILHKFGSPPVIGVSAFSSPQWIDDYVANPAHPAYIPSVFLATSHRMSVFQRIKNVLLYVYIKYQWHYNYLPEMDDVSRQYFGPSAPLPTRILHNMSLVLASIHPSFDYPRPHVPALVPIAGIHIQKPQALPKDIATFLDGAKDGAILFSLGSNIRADSMAKDKQQAFLKAFAELPQRVLWKWEAESLPGKPENVKTSKWLRQSDILAHPNLRLFITHAGLLSTQEAIDRGIPVLGIPLYDDQYINIEKLVDHGAGLKLKYNDITKETLLKAINILLSDPSYAKNMRDLSDRFRDRPQPPRQEAVYWCEYVIRHKGAQHLRSAAMDLSWYQYLLLDGLAVILVGVLTPIVLIAYCCKAVFCRTNKKQKLKKQ